jgi:hypothetical protein
MVVKVVCVIAGFETMERILLGSRRGWLFGFLVSRLSCWEAFNGRGSDWLVAACLPSWLECLGSDVLLRLWAWDPEYSALSALEAAVLRSWGGGGPRAGGGGAEGGAL